MRVRTAALSVALMMGVSACRESAAPRMRLVLVGWYERGAIVRPIVLSGSDSVGPASLRFAFTPSEAARVLPDGQLQFLRAGSLSVSATLPDNSTVSTSLNVAVPPTLVFDMTVAGNRDIYRVALDGGDLQRLTTDPGDDSSPTTAPKMPVIFVSRRDGNAQLYSLPRAGGTETRLTFTAANETQPQLSPDGASLAYVRDDRGLPRVWTSTALGANAQPLTQNFGTTGSIEAGPTLSPRGDSVVFTATVDGTANLFLTRMTGAFSPLRLIPASTDTARVEAAWSPDGRKVAFAAAGAGGGAASRLFVLELSTSQITRLTDGSASVGQPSWLQDGRLLFTRFGATRSDLCWLDPAAPSAIHAIPTTGNDAQHPHGEG